MRSSTNKETLDVENVDFEKDEIYAPHKNVDIKTYNLNSLIKENISLDILNYQCNIEQNFIQRGYRNTHLYKLSNVLEEQFLSNNIQHMSQLKDDKNDEISNNQEEKHYRESKNVSENIQEESITKEHISSDKENSPNNNNNNDLKKHKKRNEKSVLTNTSVNNNLLNNDNNEKENVSHNEHTDIEKKNIMKEPFVPPSNRLIIQLLNELTSMYKNEKEIYKNNIPIFKKIIKFGAMWIFYIYKNIQNEKDAFFLNYYKYIQIKLHDILGALFILRRCALYPELSKYIIHLNFNTNILYYDSTCPHVLINLIDMLHIHDIYFLSSWKIKTAILKTIIAFVSNAYVMNLFCNYVS